MQAIQLTLHNQNNKIHPNMRMKGLIKHTITHLRINTGLL
jgi:hypothetical protein